MVVQILILGLLLQTPSKTTQAPIEKKPENDQDARRLSQYPSLGGGLYNIDAVPEVPVPQPPLPPAATDPLYKQKRIISDLSKRLDQASALLAVLDSPKTDRRKTFQKAAGLFHDIAKDFGARNRKNSTAPSTPSRAEINVEHLAKLIAELRTASKALQPEVLDISLAERLARLASSAAAISDSLAK